MTKGFADIEKHKLTLLPPFDHKEPVDDDCGLPENPILSNYSKYLWTSHRRTGGWTPGRSWESNDRSKV